MTHDDKLIRMANQIGTFFESMSDRKEALEGIARHLKKFWDPRMRAALMAQVDNPDCVAISLIVLAAAREYRTLLTPVKL
jgi:formate dehydrogenase subunit delta